MWAWLARVATRDSALARGERRSRLLRLRMAEAIGTARRSANLSLREVARRVGVSLETMVRLERGDPATMTVDLLARVAEVLGLELAASLHPAGDPIRDRRHLALLQRFRARLPARARWRTEVPVPIAGDLRSADGVVAVAAAEILVEAETHLRDFQAVERRIGAKARDLGADRAVLLLADTRHNRALVNTIPAVRERFPVDMRAWFRAIARGEDPGGDALVIL
jgi:transcriptional regulator with XRE-family HTH domain